MWRSLWAETRLYIQSTALLTTKLKKFFFKKLNIQTTKTNVNTNRPAQSTKKSLQVRREMGDICTPLQMKKNLDPLNKPAICFLLLVTKTPHI